MCLTGVNNKHSVVSLEGVVATVGGRKQLCIADLMFIHPIA